MTRTDSLLRLFVPALLALFVAANPFAAAIPLDDKGLPAWRIAEWNDTPVRIELADRAALDALLAAVPIASFEREQIRPGGTRGSLVFTPRVTDREALALAAAGYDFEILPDLERLGRQAAEAHWATRGAGGKIALPNDAQGVYLTHEELGLDLAQLATTYPGICRVFTWGSSIEGRELWGVTISADVDNSTAEPEVRLSGSIHGNEPVGMFLLVELAHYLLENHGQPGYEQGTELVDSTEITLLPLHNPDGYLANTRENANLVDLNRNFPEPAGTHPDLELENLNFRTLARNHHYVVSGNLHSGALVVNYPWDYTYRAAPDEPAIILLSLEYSTTNLPMYNGLFPQGITNGADWYVTYGSLQDWSYEMTDCIDLTLELSNVKWPAESELDGLWEDNRESLLNLIASAHYGVHGLVTGSDTGQPLEATIEVTGIPMPVETDPMHGDYYKLLPTGTFEITFSASGYLDHTVSGVNTHWGSGLTLDVALDPIPHGTIAGTVKDLWREGLDAQVTVYGEPEGAFVASAAAEAAQDGAYTLQLEYDEYRVVATAAGHLPETRYLTVSEVPVDAEFRLLREDTAYLVEDDFENALGAWSGDWGLATPPVGHLSTNCLCDSPGVPYPDDTTTIMQLVPTLDLGTALSGSIEFWARWEVEEAWDGAYIEISADGGATWEPQATAYTVPGSGQGGQTPLDAPAFQGFQSEWVPNIVDLTPWLGAADLRCRFRFASDATINYAGFELDDFRVKITHEQDTSPVNDMPLLTARLAAAPNPFNPITTVRFTVPETGPADLSVFDLQGRLVRTLAQGRFAAGEHVRRWDGTLTGGGTAASGAYFVLLKAGEHRVVRKVSLVK